MTDLKLNADTITHPSFFLIADPDPVPNPGFLTFYDQKLAKYLQLWRVPRINTLGPHPLTVTLGRSLYITISRLSGLFITCNKPGIKPY